MTRLLSIQKPQSLISVWARTSLDYYGKVICRRLAASRDGRGHRVPAGLGGNGHPGCTESSESVVVVVLVDASRLRALPMAAHWQPGSAT